MFSNIKNSNEERYEWLGYVFSVKGLNWLDYKYEIKQALKQVCGNNFELININQKFFYVEAPREAGLDAGEYSSSKGNDYKLPFLNYEFIDKLYKFIPKLISGEFSANYYTPTSKVKTCYREENSGFSFDPIEEMKIIELGEMEISRMGLNNILFSMYKRKYIYIGEVIEEMKSDGYQYYMKNKIGYKGAIYASGFDKNLYLLYEMEGDKKTIYECEQYFYDLDSEKEYLKIKKPDYAKHNVSIDGIKYSVYQEYVKYIGQLSSMYIEDIYELGYCNHGKLYLRDSNEVYEGNFVENKYNGLGKLVKSRDDQYSEAFSYEGNFYNGEFSGVGVLYDRNHIIRYNGEWDGGKRCGSGTAYNEDGSILYTGHWQYDKYDGSGTLFNIDGSIKYNGDWYEGRTEEEQHKYDAYCDLMSECVYYD